MSTSRTLAIATGRAQAWLAILVLLSALVLMSACAPRGPLFMQAAPEGPPAPTIAVLQSDVLIVNGEPVRLADAVTPLPSPDARCAAEALGARQAEHRLKDLVHGVRTATITPTGARDEMNRPYAHVLLDGEDPAHDLIEDGLAVAADGKRFDWCGPISASFPRGEHIANLSFSGA
jgi:endonuclease YncB( thermonuclease family)